jgi:hypothetical protein
LDCVSDRAEARDGTPFRPINTRSGPGGTSHHLVSGRVGALNAWPTKTSMNHNDIEAIERHGRSRGKYRHLLEEDQQLRRWYDNVSRGSKVTADVYIRRLGSICASRNTNPRELIKKGKEDQEFPVQLSDGSRH